MVRKILIIIIAFSFIFTIFFPEYAWTQVSLAPLVKKIQPAVATVITYNTSGEQLALGSGFFISKEGLLITNYHVVQGAYRIIVETADGIKYSSKIVLEEDKRSDIVCFAVDIPKSKVKYLKVTVALPEVGDRIMVIGSPLGLEQTISDGVVSAIRTMEGFGEILQISAPISRGSSGGPVVNLKGEVVGVATFQIVGGQNLNFAIPGFRVLSIQKRAENYLLKEGNIKDENAKESIKPGTNGLAYLTLLYRKYYNQGMKALDQAKRTLERDQKEKNQKMEMYREAIRSLNMALLIKPHDISASYALEEAKFSLRKLQDKRN
jgi:S1-C subfamily serine protease